MKETLGNTATPAQKAEFDAWVSSRPQEPVQHRPVEKQAFMPFGIGIPLMFMGGLVGFMLMVLCIAFWNINVLVAFLIFIATIFFLSMVLPVGAVLIADGIYARRYRREMHDSGWAAFDVALKEWRQGGEAKFATLAQHDYLTNVRLRLHLDFD